MVTARAVLIGMLVAMAGTIPRNLLFAANLRFFPELPWAVPLTAVYLFLFWRYLGGAGPPASTAACRKASLNAGAVPLRTWCLALAAGVLAIAGLVVALRIENRLVVLPPQGLPDLAGVPDHTVLALLLMAAPVAGIVEEAAFRGYMQGALTRHHGPVTAILISGTMFAVAHLDFTWALWPYYLAVAGIYGAVTSLTGSILPALVLHTLGNVYSNLDLWLHGQAEWQAPATSNSLVWTTGADADLWRSIAVLLALGIAAGIAFRMLSRSRVAVGTTGKGESASVNSLLEGSRR